MIFNKNNNGREELRNLLGFIDASTLFDKWKTWLILAERNITNITGRPLFQMAEKWYFSPESPNGNNDDKISINNSLVEKIQRTNALFAYIKLLPMLDANHSNSGRKQTLGELDKQLTAIQAYKDEESILSAAYE